MREHLFTAVASLLAVALPIVLLPTVGLPETWEAFSRYSSDLLSFPERHTLRVPKAGAATSTLRDYAALDGDLVAWHADASRLYAQCSSMAVVGLMSDGDPIQLTFNRAAGAESRRLKQDFYARRDLSILAYLGLTVLAYTSRSVPLAVLVVTLNIINLGICLRLKELTDALSVAVDQLADAQQELLLLPLEAGREAALQQTLVLMKLRAMGDFWSSATFCYSITVPGLGSLSVSTSIMASLAAATSARCLHRIVKDLPPQLRALLTGRKGGHAPPNSHGKDE